MAHPNIEERRAAVYKLAGGKKELQPKQRRELAATFNCSPAAIYADLIELKKPGRITLHANVKVRSLVLERDDVVCQYCGTEWEPGLFEPVVEHVIPRIKGGVGKAYNLVCACQSCNCIKRSNVWVPINFQVLQEANPEWAKRIESLAVKDCRPTPP